VQAVVATGVAFHLTLRAAEKSNSNSLIPLASVVVCLECGIPLSVYSVKIAANNAVLGTY